MLAVGGIVRIWLLDDSLQIPRQAFHPTKQRSVSDRFCGDVGSRCVATVIRAAAVKIFFSPRYESVDKRKDASITRRYITKPPRTWPAGPVRPGWTLVLNVINRPPFSFFFRCQAAAPLHCNGDSNGG